MNNLKTATTAHITLRDKPLVRWGVLLMIALTMFFAYMFVDVLSPLKTMLEGIPFRWSSTVFGTYGGSEFFLNVFLLFLIFAGVILDRMGIRFTAILSGGLMVLGALIKVYALSTTFNNGGFGYTFLSSFWTSFPASAKLACVGFAIFGCGCEMGGVTVSRTIVKWFEGKELALAMGLEMAIARLGVAAVFFISPIIAQKYGTPQMSVIFVTILLVIALFIYIVYGFIDRKLDQQDSSLKQSGEEEPPFKFSDLKHIAFNKMFWIVALLCVLFYSAIFPFQKFATEMLQSNLGMDEKLASQIFSIFPFGAMALTPLLGFYLDRIGKGATMLIVGSILMFVCHLTFAIFPFSSVAGGGQWVAITAIIILGISFSLVPAALWPSVPKIIDKKVLGSAYSSIFFIQNIGLMSVPIIIGSVLDKTNPHLVAGEPKNYTIAMLVFASFGVLAFVLGFVLKMEDKKKGYGLELPNVKKAKEEIRHANCGLLSEE